VTISFVRLTSNSVDSSATTITSTFAANTGGGLAVIGVYYVDGGTISVSSVVDDNGNTWTPAAAETYNATQGYSERLYYAWNLIADAGTVTITATFSAATTFRRIHGAEYSSSFGAWTADPLSTTGTGTGNGTALATGTITPARNNAMICCAGSNPGGSISAGTSFTLRSPSGGGASTGFADHIQTTLTAETAKLTSSGSGQWGITGATFLDAGWIAPAAILASTSFPTATKSAGATVTATAITATTSMPAPVVSAGGTNVTPTVITATTSMPAPTVSGGATVTATAITATTSFPSAAVTATTPLPFEGLIRVALGADPDSDLSLLAEEDWTDITDYVRYRQGVVIRAGRHGLGSNTDPLQMRLRLANGDGRFTPFLNTGAYYPYIRRFLPIQVQVSVYPDDPVELATAFIDTYEMAWDESANDCVVDIVANGRLWAISRRKVSAPAATRSVITTDPVAYWPLTDGSSASQAASGLTGGAPMTKSGSIKFGTGQGLTGQPNILDLAAIKNTIGKLSASIPAGSVETSWRVEFQLNWASLEATDDAIGPEWSTGGTISGWQIRYRHSDDTLTLRYTLADGSGVVDLATSKTDPYDGITRVYRVTADQSGANIDVALTIDGTSYLSSTINTHTLGRPTVAKLRTCFSFTTGYDGSQAPAVGHYTFWAPYDSVTVDTGLAATGYAGETAGDRVARLCEEAGIPATVLAGDTTPMGIQGDGTLGGLLAECETADAGILHDAGPFGSLVYIPRSHRYNRAPDMTIDVDLRHLSPGFRPTLDGRDLVTAMTVSQPEGTSGTYTAESDEGTQPRSLTANIADTEDPVQHAAWRVGVGMAAGMRYQKVSLDLRRSEDLQAIWLATGGIDLRADVTNLPQQHAPHPVQQFVEGYELGLTPHMLRVNADCVPAEPYEVIVLDTSAATLLTSVDADDTTWTSVVDAPPRWTTVDVPVDLEIGGETVTATDIDDVAITYVAAGAATFADNANVTPAMYAGAQAGDLICVFAASRTTAPALDTPAGYTVVLNAFSTFRLYTKIHDGSESDPTIAISGGSAGETVGAFTFGFRNTVADATEAILDVTAWSGTTTPEQDIPYPPTRMPKYDGCAVVYLGRKADDWTSVAAIAGATEIQDASSTLGSDIGLVADYVIQTSAAAIPTGSFVVTGGASAAYMAGTAVIAPGKSTLTVTRAVDGTAIAHTAGDPIMVARPGRLAL
jgi:hypothetical protein